MTRTAAAREAFASAAAGYDRGNPLLAVERVETAALLPELEGLAVLDLGAGTGFYSALAARRGARLALAVDLVPEMALRCPRPAVVADAALLPLAAGSVDLVIAALLLSYVRDAAETLAEVGRVLGAGGTLVLSDLHPVASELGWRRSFTGKAGERLLVEAPPPRLEALCAALEGAGLAIDARRVAPVDERLRGAFAQAGRRDFDALAGTPLLQLLRARKTGRHAR